MRSACERGHTEHATRTVPIKLGGPTGFGDYAPIPWRFVRTFEMQVYERGTDCNDPRYCPACDAVSEMLTVHGMWEPQETVLALTVLETAPPGSGLTDFGSHLGWYSFLAASCGVNAVAYDSDAESQRVLQQTAAANGWEQLLRPGELIQDWQRPHVESWCGLIGPETPPLGNCYQHRLVKIDIEGAEFDAVRMMWPSIIAGMVDHILMEVSPTLAPGYPELVAQIIAEGYRCYAMPPKQYPPVTLDDPERDLAPWCLSDMTYRAMMDWVAECRQANVWFQRDGASW